MNPLLTVSSLLAGIVLGADTRPRGFQWDLGAVLIGVMALVAVIGLAWFFLRRQFTRSQSGFSDPRELFDELCAAHALNWQKVSLLERLAARHRVEPARLFVEPFRFETEGFDAELAVHEGEFAALRDKFFALPADEHAAA